MEEAYTSTLAKIIAVEILKHGGNSRLTEISCGDRFFYKGSSREEMYEESGISESEILKKIKSIL